jgi:hypothetical protein
MNGLKISDAVGFEQVHEFSDVEKLMPGWDVLQNDIGINEIELASGKEAQIYFDVQMIFNLVPVPVELLRLSNHGRGNIHAIDSLEMLRQRLGQSSQTAAKIQRRSLMHRDAGFPDSLEDASHFLFSRGKEFFGIPFPAAFVVGRQNGPHRVAFA